jgi:cytochrome c-type biogenesis protein CcmF
LYAALGEQRVVDGQSALGVPGLLQPAHRFRVYIGVLLIGLGGCLSMVKVKR